MDTAHPTSRPIFSDDSGRRAAILQWLARGVCGVSVVVAGAVAFTLTTHVPLPGLDRILSPRGGAEAGLTIRAVPTEADSLGFGRSLSLARRVASAASPAAATGHARTGASTSDQVARVPSRRTATTPQATAQPSATSEPQGASQGAGPSNPHAVAKGANSGNPRAAAKGSNSSARATPGPGKSAQAHASTARAKAKQPGPPAGTPARPKKKK